MAVTELRRALASHPDELEVRATLGRLLLSEHRDLEATKEFGELLEVLDRQGLMTARERLE